MLSLYRQGIYFIISGDIGIKYFPLSFFFLHFCLHALNREISYFKSVLTSWIKLHFHLYLVYLVGEPSVWIRQGVMSFVLTLMTWKKNLFCSLHSIDQENFPLLIETEGWLPSSQQHTSGSYPDADEFIPHPQNLYIILTSNLASSLQDFLLNFSSIYHLSYTRFMLYHPHAHLLTIVFNLSGIMKTKSHRTFVF